MRWRRPGAAVAGAVSVLVLFGTYGLGFLAGRLPERADPHPRSASPQDSGEGTRPASVGSAPAPAVSFDSAAVERASSSGEPPLADANARDGAGGEEPGRTTGPGSPGSPMPLLIPVAGVRAEDLVDTYAQARSEGRRHDAIDIMAPRGSPVFAVADGTVLKLFRSEQGGLTLYQLDPDQRTLYYYAHLDRYEPLIVEGMRLWRGQTIGYVGDTGNAGAGNYHLHFEISTTQDPKQYWGGTPTNPFPLLQGTRAANR